MDKSTSISIVLAGFIVGIATMFIIGFGDVECKEGIVKEKIEYMETVEDGLKKQKTDYLIRCQGGMQRITSDNDLQLESTVKLEWINQSP